MKSPKETFSLCEAQLKKRILAFARQHGSGEVSDEAWAEFYGELSKSHAADEGGAARGPTKCLALFESLESPAFILDEQFNIEAMNRSAERFVGKENALGELAYARSCMIGSIHETVEKRKPLAEVVPWLAEGLLNKCQTSTREQSACRFDVTTPQKYGGRHFTVMASKLTGIFEDTTGYAIVLEDISLRVEGERQLSRERNRASHYLNMVASIVLAMDASGSVTMINRAGCQAFGYEEHELFGQDWVETMIPSEVRDEVRDYLSFFMSGDAGALDENVNYVSTKSGEHRLVQWKNQLLKNDAGIPVGILCSGIDITERRAMEDALAEKELWLRSTFVALGEAVLILTPDRKILDANPAAETMFQMSNAELEGLPVEQLHIDQEHNERFRALCEAAFARGERAQFEFPLKRNNGEVFPSENSVSLIIGDDGNPLGVVNTMRDISARKKAEQVLRQSEEKFRRIFETIEEGYMVTDMEGTIQMVNPATCGLLHYSETELIGRPTSLLYSEQRELERFKRTVSKDGAVRGFQLTARRKDGVSIVVEVNSHVVASEEGEFVGTESTFRDITDRIKAEKMLREREKQYRAFFENNHAVMLLVDPKTEHIIDANPAASEFYGYDLDVMRTMNMSQIYAQSSDDIFREMENSRKERRSFFILKHALANGELRDVEVYSGPIMVQGKQRLYSVIHDVTKRIELEHEMKLLATTDALTGVNNRHQFFTLGVQEMQRTKRYKHALTVLMLDIDYFKSINDTYGHNVGDLVLKMLAKCALSTLRESDVFGRLGGEEFAVILPETGIREGQEVAERLRLALAGLKAAVGNEEISFTVSIGCTLVREKDKSIEEVLNRADEALYKAKRMGRNRVERA